MKTHSRYPTDRYKCPQRAQHTEGPYGYVDWQDWATAQAKTHRQEQCPGCDLWLIWVPLEAAASSEAA